MEWLGWSSRLRCWMLGVVLACGLVGPLAQTVPAQPAVPEAEPPLAEAAVVDPPAAPPGADQAEGQSLLAFFYQALGFKYVVVFLLLSLGLVALLVMCFLQLRRSVLMPSELTEAFEAHLDKKEYQQAYELARASESPLGRVLSAGMAKLQGGHASAMEAVQEAEAAEAMRLEQKISYVSLVGALAPMFGLLGTVDGMVSAFRVIAQSATTPKPAELASGISQALVTTLIGLWLAIPAIACFALFRNWVQQMNAEIDSEGVRLFARFQKR